MIVKEWRCATDGDFESELPICPKCRKLAKRVFLTPFNIGSVKEQNINRVLDDVLPSQNLSNYTNATGHPKPTFSNIYQNDSGMAAGWGIESMYNLPGVQRMPKEATLARMNPETGAREQIDVAAWANGLPKSVSAVSGSQVGRGGMLKARTAIERRYEGK